jgi:hypothetical protein
MAEFGSHGSEQGNTRMQNINPTRKIKKKNFKKRKPPHEFTSLFLASC